MPRADRPGEPSSSPGCEGSRGTLSSAESRRPGNDRGLRELPGRVSSTGRSTGALRPPDRPLPRLLPPVRPRVRARPALPVVEMLDADGAWPERRREARHKQAATLPAMTRGAATADPIATFG